MIAALTIAAGLAAIAGGITVAIILMGDAMSIHDDIHGE